MSIADVVNQQNFDVLLRWLDEDRDAAGEKYEKIRGRLIRTFAGRGCTAPEDLADETINRVIKKLPQIADSFVADPINYFFGVAKKVYLEWLRKQKSQQLHVESPVLKVDADDSVERSSGCLDECLGTLSGEQRHLILAYYQGEKSSKILGRKELSRELGISATALQIKAHRIRSTLKACMENCLAKNIRERF